MMDKRLHLEEEAARCLLCADAPCSQVCKNGDPARAIRAIRFGNEKLAGRWVAECTDEDLEAAERACIHYDRPIRIREMMSLTKEIAVPEASPRGGLEGASLSIDFCGIRCENPFFLASSAVCTNYEMVARAFEAGWAGVFYKTICLQEIREVSPRFDACQQEGSADFYAFRNMEQLSENPVEMDFDILHRLKQNYPSKVVVASIMGQNEEEWIKLAKMAEAAGVDAVELNFSCPQMRMAGMGSDVGQNPELVLFYTAFVKRSVSIPVIPKMTPNITHITEPTMSAFFAGADAISAINTIKSVTMGDRARVSGHKTISGLSGRAVRPIALRHILEMAQTSMTRTSSRQNDSQKNLYGKGLEISGIGGIETWRDALEFIQLGCRNVQVCTAVMQYGYRIIDDLILGMQNYLMERGLSSLEPLVGEELPNFVTPTDLDRETIVYPKIDRDKCIGCGRCYTSCMDGGHQAIAFDTETRQPRIVGTKCVGCHLCRLVCPTGAIGMTKRINKKS
ncbi:MAG: NAD-dependent dihydropyrimidine dehydrogenase subunit PreA [Bacteroidaceae bacterium]|nr:NAD-dependent dihydropyrimidine dehydrogenase subunit PreA [Bacteroidaceae bacterium]